MNRDTWAAVVATIVVIAVIILGLRVLGGPHNQRLVQADQRTLQTLGNLAQQIKVNWESSGKILPANLDKFPPSARRNPITKEAFVYRPNPGSAYDLCATFLTDTRNRPNQNGDELWNHPQGYYCFHLDAAQQVPSVPYYY